MKKTLIRIGVGSLFLAGLVVIVTYATWIVPVASIVLFAYMIGMIIMELK